jgi:hypothetical protein
MPSPSATLARPRPSPVYDNLFYVGKPDTKKYGPIRRILSQAGNTTCCFRFKSASAFTRQQQWRLR